MTAPLRVGVIGVGDFGQRHLRAYAGQPDVTVVAVADKDSERARTVAARWGVQRWFVDPAALIESCRPDGVSVVTPGHDHQEPTLAALDGGCAVLLEKPIAMSSAEVATIETAVERSTTFVMPAHILRFAAPYVALHARVRDGAVGQLLGISASRDRSRSHARRYADVHLALMTAIHDIDLAIWFSGSRALRVSAYEQGREAQGPPLLVWGQVEAVDGTVWSIRGSWLLPDSSPLSDRLELYGTHGAAVLDLAPTVRILSSPIEAVDHELTPDAHRGAIDAEISHFCACIRNRAASDIVTLADAAHGVHIAEALIASAGARGRPVDVGA